jgi:hypothetical protein
VVFDHFVEFFSSFASRVRSRAAKPAGYEIPSGFLSFGGKAAKAGVKLKGLIAP